MEEEKDRVLRQILGMEPEIGRKSTLQLALNQARKLGGVIQGELVSRTQFLLRKVNEEHDAKEIANTLLSSYHDEEMDVLTSLSLYLIVLDQLGHIFGKRSNDSNRVKDAIDAANVTSKMNEEELNAIRNLRNSINHNFGLANYNPSKGIGLFKYTLCFEDDGNQKPVVEPIKKWDGAWSDKEEDTSVHVYPFSLINYIEDIVLSFINQYTKGIIQSPLSADELKTRFTILVNEDADNESLSTEVTEEDLNNSWTDGFGVKYSSDKKRLLRMPPGELEMGQKLSVIMHWHSIIV